jgi:MYXO-CTERM domain-containing protein
MTKHISRGVLLAGLVGTYVTAASPAWAHFDLMEPAQAQNNKGGKGGPPCPAGAATNAVTEVMGGKMLSLKINETTYHPGHYRIALAATKEGLPMEPAVQKKPGGDSMSATIDPAPQLPVLKDGALVHTAKFNGAQTIDVMIPDMNCDKCTLQVIEFMADHSPPYFYHQCATLKITASAGGTPDGGADTAPGTGGTAGGTGGSAPGSGGVSSSGGSSGSGGAASGGSSGSGSGGVASGGSSGSASGGSSGARGGSSGSTGGSSSSSPSDGGGSGGGCSVGSGSPSVAGLALAAVFAGFVRRRRRRTV